MKRLFVLTAMAALVVAFGARADDDAGGKPNGGKPGAHHGAKMLKLLQSADANGDGKISLEEFKAALAKAAASRENGKGKGKGHGERAEKLFKHLDADGDGFITKDEIRQAMQKMAEHRKNAGKKPKE